MREQAMWKQPAWKRPVALPQARAEVSIYLEMIALRFS
jgi:hypothetical protein